MIYLVIIGLTVSLCNLILILGLIGNALKTQAASVSSSHNTKATGESVASFMEYVAAFQGEDMMFDKELRERASSHLSQLAETLREDLETV